MPPRSSKTLKTSHFLTMMQPTITTGIVSAFNGQRLHTQPPTSPPTLSGSYRSLGHPAIPSAAALRAPQPPLSTSPPRSRLPHHQHATGCSVFHRCLCPALATHRATLPSVEAGVAGIDAGDCVILLKYNGKVKNGIRNCRRRR